MSSNPRSDISQDVVDEFVTQSSQSYGKVRRFLIEHPDLINKRSSWGETALIAARRAGQHEIEQFLLSAGAPESPSECAGMCYSATVDRLT